MHKTNGTHIPYTQSICRKSSMVLGEYTNGFYIMPWYFNAYFGFLKYQILMPFKLLGMIGEGAKMEFTKTKVLVDEWSEKNKNVK